MGMQLQNTRASKINFPFGKRNHHQHEQQQQLGKHRNHHLLSNQSWIASSSFPIQLDSIEI